MTAIEITINKRKISADVVPRLHLADFLRERENLTATHLRCEQGACGACTVLIDGQPARSCITYAVMCDGASVTTVEGLEADPVMMSLRRAFSEEHGLQCGYCTPGMLVTARDVILRLPDADQARIRMELSGNLCRCTGYVGIVRAIEKVLAEHRRGEIPHVDYHPAPIGPVGARTARAVADRSAVGPSPVPMAQGATAETVFGLRGRQPNVEIRQSFTVSRAPADVWDFLGDITRVVSCMPGARLTRPPDGDVLDGQMSVKLGPITANFAGQARIERNDQLRRSIIMGAGRDQSGGSRAAGEAEYALTDSSDGGTLVSLSIRALLVGPLAQFGRSAIVEDLVSRITATFARNLEARLDGTAPVDDSSAQVSFQMGSLVSHVVWGRLKSALTRIFGRSAH